MNYKRVNNIVAVVILVVTSAVYLYTMQPGLSFWDCGEFVACANTLSVPHPPGAPLWILVGKVAIDFLPFGSNAGVKMNALSAISSGFTAMFLYLIIVMVIKKWRNFPKTGWEAVIFFGSAAVGALSYAFCDTAWFNAVEAEVYALGTTLIALSIWILMYWWDRADEPGSERYLLLFAFIIGLSLGIHLLVVQVILVAAFIYYFRKFEYTRKSFIIMFLIAAGAFVLVYPVIVIWYPGWLGGDIKTLKIEDSNVVTWLAILVIPLLIYGAYRYWTLKKTTAATALVGVFLVILGYSLYASVLLRARVDNLPINENEPKSMPVLVSYLSREQYGDAPFLPRRHSQEPMHRRTWTNYTSDMDFLWRYQINHMFNRYLGWQYIGRAGYTQDEGIDWSKLYGIPFLFGLFGLFYHFRKDWKLGLTFLWAFLLMGILSALFQRQQDPQPRERDYFYTGAFFVYSLWIGLGVMGVLELIQEGIKNSGTARTVGAAVLVFSFAFIPANMVRTNFFYNNRHNNYVPFDYAYNILQSIPKDGIVFTNGDNDTFPLWYLQAVEGIRTDVRVVNLSLLNTDWYIKEMKNSMPYGALKVPISLSDAQIERLQPTQWSDYKVMNIPVPPEAYPDSMRKAGNTPDKITFRMPATINYGNVKGVKVQDLMIYDIVKTNNWQRPIYFSATVSDDNYIGLDDYLITEGMGKRLVPYKDESKQQFRLDPKLMWENYMVAPASYSKTPQPGYFFRGFNDPNIFFDQTSQNTVQNYRQQYLMLAYYFADTNAADAGKVLDKMEENFPRSVIPVDYRILYDVAMLYHRIGNESKFTELSTDVEQSALAELNRNPNDIQSYYNPYRLLMDIYEAKGEYKKAVEILEKLDRLAPGSPEVKQKLEMLRSKMN
jgi:hypothetical protein